MKPGLQMGNDTRHTTVIREQSAVPMGIDELDGLFGIAKSYGEKSVIRSLYVRMTATTAGFSGSLA